MPLRTTHWRVDCALGTTRVGHTCLFLRWAALRPVTKKIFWLHHLKDPFQSITLAPLGARNNHWKASKSSKTRPISVASLIFWPLFEHPSNHHETSPNFSEMMSKISRAKVLYQVSQKHSKDSSNWCPKFGRNHCLFKNKIWPFLGQSLTLT